MEFVESGWRFGEHAEYRLALRDGQSDREAAAALDSIRDPRGRFQSVGATFGEE